MRTFESLPMHSPIPRWSTRATGRNPSPRFASVVGHTQMRAPAAASRSSSCPSACVAWTIVVRGPRQPVSSSSSIGRMPVSAMHSSISRGCSSACTCSGSSCAAAYAPSSRSASGGQARTEWGAMPTRMPSARSASTCCEVVRHRLLPEALDAAAEVAGVEEDERDAGLGSRLGRGTRLLEPEVVELADRREAVRAELPVDLDVLAADLLDAQRAGQREHPVAPRPEVAAPVAAAQGALERVAMRVDEARRRPICMGISCQCAAPDPECPDDRPDRPDPGLCVADHDLRRRPVVAGRDRLRRRRGHRPDRRLPRAALARRVAVREDRRPARRPADDRRGGDPARPRRPPAVARAADPGA